MCVLGVLTTYRKLRLEYYNCITGARSLGLCAKTKRGLGGRGKQERERSHSQNKWLQAGINLEITSACASDEFGMKWLPILFNLEFSFVAFVNTM